MALRASYYGLKKRILDKVLGDYDAVGVMTNKDVTKILNGLTVKSFVTETLTINAGQYSAQELSVVNGDLIPLGVVGYKIDGSGNTVCSMWKNWFDVTNKKVLFGINNISASATATVTATVYVLYKG